MDILSELVGHLGLRCQPPVVHTFEDRWAVEVPGRVPRPCTSSAAGAATLWARAARHSVGLGEGSLLFLSGAVPVRLQAHGPRLEVSGTLDWRAGRPLRRTRTPPGTPSAVQLVSTRVEVTDRPAPVHRLPEIVVVGVRQIPLPRSYRPLSDALLEELSMPRMGGEAIIRHFLDVLVIQALRIHVMIGFGSTEGWLGPCRIPCCAPASMTRNSSRRPTPPGALARPRSAPSAA